MLSDNTSCWVIGALILVICLYYFLCKDPIPNEGSLQQSTDANTVYYNAESDDGSSYMTSDDSYHGENAVSANDATADDSVDSSLEIIKERAMGRNNLYARRTAGSAFKPVSYRSGYRKNKDTDYAFKVDDVTKNYTDRFVPVDESNGNGAPINLCKEDRSEVDRYNINSYLPQEEEKDWFETIETVDVKNSHLINIYRPIGVNTIGSSLKNASYDIRGNGSAIAPKFVVSPWLQSSYEPDRSSKILC